MDQSKRFALKAISSLPFVLSFSVSLANPLKVPSQAKKLATFENRFGIEISDSYRWMETAPSPGTDTYSAGQTSYARALLDAIPGRGPFLKKLLNDTAQTDSLGSLVACHIGVFYSKRLAGTESYKIFFKGHDSVETLVFNPEPASAKHDRVEIDWWSPSPDGKYIAFGLSINGTENTCMRIMDVRSTSWLSETYQNARGGAPKWLADSSGFFYVKLRSGFAIDDPEALKKCSNYLHVVGTDPSTDQLILDSFSPRGIPLDDDELPVLIPTADGKYVIAEPTGLVRRCNPRYVAKLQDVIAKKNKWELICEVKDQVVQLIVRKNEIFMLALPATGAGRLVRSDIGHPSFSMAREIYSNTDGRLEAFGVSKDNIYLGFTEAGYRTIYKLLADGSSSFVAPEKSCSIDNFYCNPNNSDFFYSQTNWFSPTAWFEYNETLNRNTRLDISGNKAASLQFPYEAHLITVKSRDGVHIPATILFKKGMTQNSNNPVLLTAYGSYGYTTNQPSYSGSYKTMLDTGLIYVLVGVRGGGEYGGDWWRAGKEENKYHSWNDLIDTVDYLIAQHWTKVGLISIEGGSAGGIVVGKAMTERPDLFASVISHVGLTNPSRIEAMPTGFGNAEEFGDPETEDGFRALFKMDTYQSIRDGVSYPGVLLTAGANDFRVPAWQAKKTAARLQEATTSAKPVLLLVEEDEGHGTNDDRSKMCADLADTVAFALWQSGKWRGPGPR